MTATDRSLPAWNPQIDIERRVDDLLSRMTLEDKVALLFHPTRRQPSVRPSEADGCGHRQQKRRPVRHCRPHVSVRSRPAL